MGHEPIQRELYVEASPEVVFDVVSNPRHVGKWWADEAEFAAAPGARGELTWIDKATAHAAVVPITVTEAIPHRLFSFRWVYPEGEAAAFGNSLLVSFELMSSGTGTLLRLTEDDFDEMGWEPGPLAEYYSDHSKGWDIHMDRLASYLSTLTTQLTAPTSHQDPKGLVEIVERFEKAFRANDQATIDELCDPDLIDHNAPDGDPTLAAFKKKVAYFKAPFPDLAEDLQDIIASGNTVATRWLLTGTLQHEFMGIPAAGQKIRVEGMNFYRLRNGLVTDMWTQFDGVAMMQQLGANV